MNHEQVDRYEAAIHLLKLVKADFRRAGEELLDLSSHFIERAAEASLQLNTTFDATDEAMAKCSNIQQKEVPRLSPHESSPSLEVCCLGIFQVGVGLKKIKRWQSTRAKSLLKYLVTHHKQPISREELMEALWPGSEPSLAGNNLRAAVHALRQTLADACVVDDSFDWILTQDGQYKINPEVNLRLDFEQFDFHWYAGRRLLRQGKLPDAIKEHEIAEALYKGDFLVEDIYHDWTALRREALKDRYIAILVRLADYGIEQADYESCILYSQKMLDKDSCREDAYRRLMCCHSRLGQRSRAIGWFRLCEKTIKAELDVKPDHLTIALYHRLLNDEEI